MLVLYFKHATIKLYLTLSHVNVGLVTHPTIEAMTWVPGLSRNKPPKLLAETYFNVSSKQVSPDVAPSNIKSRILIQNVETGLKMLLSSAILADLLFRFLIGLRSVASQDRARSYETFYFTFLRHIGRQHGGRKAMGNS